MHTHLSNNIMQLFLVLTLVSLRTGTTKSLDWMFSTAATVHPDIGLNSVSHQFLIESTMRSIWWKICHWAIYILQFYIAQKGVYDTVWTNLYLYKTRNEAVTLAYTTDLRRDRWIWVLVFTLNILHMHWTYFRCL